MHATKVRMVVYCGKYLRQSFDHHAARCEAVGSVKLAMDRAVAMNPSAKKMKRRRDAVTHSEAILRSMHVFAPSLVEEVLHSEGGYVSSCEAVQKTKGVFSLCTCHARRCGGT